MPGVGGSIITGGHGGTGGMGGIGGVGGIAGTVAGLGGVAGTTAGIGGVAGTGGTPPNPCESGQVPDLTCSCVRVAPDGDDALGATTGGVEPFRSIEAAVAYADAHRTQATDVCVAAGATCGTSAEYAGPAGADFEMRNGISVYAGYESTDWTRCTDSTTTLTLDDGRVVSFGADVTRLTVLDGFATGDVAASGAHGPRLVAVAAGSLSVVQSAELEARGGSYDAVSVNGAKLVLSGATATSVALDSAPGSAVHGTGFGRLAASGNVDGVELSENTGGAASVSACEGTIAITGNQFTAENFTGAGSAVALAVSGTCEALVDSNTITSQGGDGVENVGLSCVAPCTVSANTITVVKTGDVTQPAPLPPPDRGSTLALACDGCIAVSRNHVSNSVPVSIFYNRYSGYTVTGAIIEGGSTLVARNDIASGCGDTSVGLDASGARSENNVVRGGCVRHTVPFPLPTYIIRSTAMIARGGEVHSNYISSPSPGAGGVTTSIGLESQNATVRNNVIGANWTPVAYASGTFQNNNVVPGGGMGLTASDLNGLPGSSGNFAADCYPAGDASAHLNAGSPCIDAGTPTGAPAGDFDGESRDAQPDVGPDEYSSAHDPCAGITCSGHGKCELLPDEPCLCDSGYWPAASDPTACVVNKCIGACDPLVACYRNGDEAACGDCPPGYDGTGDTACIDIDECDTNNGGCDPLVTCTNSPGSHSCGPCPPGYAGSGDTGCIATTTCTPNPCDHAAACIPDVSTFTCSCPPGITGTLCDLEFTQLSLGEFYLCGVRSDGTLRVRTSLGFDVSAPSGTFTDVSSDNYHYCALATDGSVVCNGMASFGETTPPSGTFSAVDTGRFHTCVVRTDGTLACFGLNVQGSTQPPGGTFTAVTTGDNNSCALATDGSIQCFGSDSNGQSTPPSGTFTALSLGATHGCALRTDQTVACWGQNDGGEATAPSGTFLAVSCAGHFSCGIRADGTLTCWGQVPSGGPPSGQFVELTTGSNGISSDACALRSDDVVVCWGSNGWTPPTGGT